MTKRKRRNTLSVVVIARNEEDLLPGCLESVKGLGDELVVVDTGSTDRTVEIAESYGARIEQFEWVYDYAAARNYAESCCTGDYIFWIDADEVLAMGHEAIKEIVREGKENSVRPMMAFERDVHTGAINRSYGRQDLLHRKGSHAWKGTIHEYTEALPGFSGASSRMCVDIVMEERERPGGDRPHGDMFALLRSNMNGAGTCNERHLFYLAREHSAAGHYAEAVAIVDLLLTSAVEWPIQRSHSAILKGDALHALKREAEARAAYLRAIQEWGAWAEPYYALGKLHYDLEQWAEGAAWFAAALQFEPPKDGYFTNNEIYSWRRYDLLAVCLSKLGRGKEARGYGKKALAARPDDERLKKNMAFYKDGA